MPSGRGLRGLPRLPLLARPSARRPGGTAPRGPSLPTQAAALQAARERLTPGHRVALVLRRYRRERALSQRRLAQELGISKGSIARAESDAGALALAKVARILEQVGFRLAIVRIGDEHPVGEEADTAWAATDLLVRDGRGRRAPATADVSYRTEGDQRLGVGRAGGGLPWTWTMPPPGPASGRCQGPDGPGTLSPRQAPPVAADPPAGRPSSARRRPAAPRSGCP